MFHDDLQIHPTNNWKRNTNEHPIDRILTGYSNTNQQVKNSQTNIRSSNYKSETKHIIQRQQAIRAFLHKSDDFEPSIRKPTILNATSNALSITSISSPQLLYADLNEPSTNNNNRRQIIKKEIDRQSPTLNRRYRSTTDNLPSIQQMSDITNNSANSISILVPQNFTFRNKPTRILLSDKSSLKTNGRISSPRLKPLMYSKSLNDESPRQYTFNPKSNQQNNLLPLNIRPPTLSEQSDIHTRTLTGIVHSKSHLSKYITNHRYHRLQSDKTNTNSRIHYIPDLYISPRLLSRDSKPNADGTTDDDDESLSTDGNSSTSTCISQVSAQQSDVTSSSLTRSNSSDLYIDNSNSKVQRSLTKRSISRRRGYNLALPPVAEHVDDEEIDMNKILEKIDALQNKKFDISIDDEDSLTFQLLNQQETEFEKNLSKFQFKQK